MNDIDAIRDRDAVTADLWFTGPASFTAQSARDRRTLLIEIDALAARLADVVEALQEIAKGEGRFSLDHHQHACNTIEDMKALAVAAIDAAKRAGLTVTHVEVPK